MGLSAPRHNYPAQLVGVLLAGVHPPRFAGAVDELTPRHHRLAAVGRMAHSVVAEAKAHTGFEIEGFGVVGHQLETTHAVCEAPREKRAS